MKKVYLCYLFILCFLLLASPDAFAQKKEAKNKKQVGKVGADADSIHLTFKYKFRRQTEYHIADTFKCSTFDNRNIDMFNLDMTQLTDTFSISLSDEKQIRGFRFPIKGAETSTFGPRNLLGMRFHYGVDVELEEGDTLVAAMDGVVRVVRNDPTGYGLFVVITHPNGLETLSAHMSKQLVKPGQHVKAGEPIGLGGNTGRSTGPHLHFEVRFMGEPIDPNKLISFKHQKVLTENIKIDKSWFKHLEELRQLSDGFENHRRGRDGQLLGLGCGHDHGQQEKFKTGFAKLFRFKHPKNL